MEIPAKELDEWVAYDRLSPIGNYRDDLRFALLAYHLHGDYDNRTLEDYLLFDRVALTGKDKEQAEEAKERAEHLARLEASRARLQSALL